MVDLFGLGIGILVLNFKIMVKIFSVVLTCLAFSLDLAYVAAGRFEGYWESGIQSWDIAAGIVLIREAGGYVCDLKGGEDFFGSNSILASNQLLYPTLKELLIR